MRVIDRLLNASCDEVRRSLSAHIEGDVGRLKEWRLRRHLLRCDRCREVLRSLKRSIEHLRALGQAETPLTPSVADAVVGRIRGGPSP